MLTDLLILIAAAIGAGSIVYLSISLLNNMRSPSKELKHIEKQIDDFPHLPMQTESFFGTKPIKNNDMIEGVNKGILTINEARTKAGFEPFNEFQKVAHDFGETTTSVNFGGSTIRRATNCPNCGANLTQNGVCAYCGTTYN